jgi:hypothetical protein
LVGAEAMNVEFGTEYYLMLKRRRKFEIDRPTIFPWFVASVYGFWRLLG